MTFGRWFVLGMLALCAVVGAGLTEARHNAGKTDELRPLRSTTEEVTRALAGSPPALSALHLRRNQLLRGTAERLRDANGPLRGYPIVIFFWASWCGPCNQEAPILQRVALKMGRQVAFLGMDFEDNRDSARGFLQRYPVSFPSYEDPSGSILRSYGLSGYVPATVILDRTGRVGMAHQGAYLTLRSLVRDIKRYGRGGRAGVHLER